jgi:hypothetical protein
MDFSIFIYDKLQVYKEQFLYVSLLLYKVNMLAVEIDGACVMNFLHSHNEL